MSHDCRERVDEVTIAELKDDEKYVLELHFADGSANLQLSYANEVEMQRWLAVMSLVFSTGAVSDDPI